MWTGNCPGVAGPLHCHDSCHVLTNLSAFTVKMLTTDKLLAHLSFMIRRASGQVTVRCGLDSAVQGCLEELLFSLAGQVRSHFMSSCFLHLPMAVKTSPEDVRMAVLSQIMGPAFASAQ